MVVAACHRHDVVQVRRDVRLVARVITPADQERPWAKHADPARGRRAAKLIGNRDAIVTRQVGLNIGQGQGGIGSGNGRPVELPGVRGRGTGARCDGEPQGVSRIHDFIAQTSQQSRRLMDGQLRNQTGGHSRDV